MDDRIRKIKLGNIELALLNLGDYMIDGGAAYGVIPKPFWEKVTPPDERNRMKMAVNVLLIRAHKSNILVDAGFGDKMSEKKRTIFGIEEQPDVTGLLAEAGVSPDDINTVVLTHLHFDHAGGLTYYDDSGELQLTFPNAVHIVQAREWEEANHPNELNAAAYPGENIEPLEEKAHLKIIDGSYRITRGVSTVVTGGHTTSHQIIRVQSQRQVAVFLSDLVPTRHYVNLPYITAYDYFPLTTLNEKRNLFRRAATRGYLTLLAHDPEHPVGKINAHGDGTFSYDPMDGGTNNEYY
ncbi:MAG: MBL fold metallo-hydrolase [bacterium]|nr:MBL fold metallo-hydrolase [bacterium]